ncbi:hypothetical protein HK104_008281 [Borealophlyctis nickersoniae]|nr:hypothetical protein HK104_008281 [Borealophlyctis nickersoniae]
MKQVGACTATGGNELSCKIETGIPPPPLPPQKTIFVTRIVFRKLLTPPQHLLGLPETGAFHPTQTSLTKPFEPLTFGVRNLINSSFLNISKPEGIVDLASDMTLPVAKVEEDEQTARFALNSRGVYERLLLVTPTYTLPTILPVLFAHNLTLTKRWAWRPHVNFDDIGDIIAMLARGEGEAVEVAVFDVVRGGGM